jgi:hypothetical protein
MIRRLSWCIGISLILPYGALHAKECTSDYSCGVGYTCLKEMYSSKGVCAKAVDSYGTPTYRMPSNDSIGVKTDDSDMCSFSTDCPIGFKCQKSPGKIKGYCVK